tara:strand:+ start:99 stop:314 length:216 start_codon:yes stop_codon:yes gene_type:complete
MSYFEITKIYMQFTRNTNKSKQSAIIKFTIKIIFLILILFASVILLGKIDFPSPNQKIEKKISNEKFEVIK